MIDSFADRSDAPSTAGSLPWEIWGTFWTRMMSAPWSAAATASPTDAARQTRSAMLEAGAEAWDRFLRTPEFLEAMRQTMAAQTQVRKHSIDFFGHLQHEFQGVSREDLDQLMQVMRHLEHRLASGLEQIGDRLRDLEDRLSLLEKADSSQGATVAEDGPAPQRPETQNHPRS